eukprot:TRINITY_DN5737_c2_g1_i1.p1 TRINITY_DN5737_c2_g1~~TRINITY_DN5737_c2_g1_i1.p1  ORF type:complete len:106 (-),score=7.06 TRINITY_DN5737_c2_g1_i1:148-465(-)
MGYKKSRLHIHFHSIQLNRGMGTLHGSMGRMNYHTWELLLMLASTGGISMVLVYLSSSSISPVTQPMHIRVSKSYHHVYSSACTGDVSLFPSMTRFPLASHNSLP